MEAGYVVIVEFDGHPRFVIRPKVRKGVLEYHFNIKMLGEQEINVPFVENVYGRDAKPKEDLP